MATQFALSGSYTAEPLDGVPSLDPSIGTPIEESMQLAYKTVVEAHLTTDAPATVAFGGVTNANVVILKVVSGKVKARLTSADGATQAVPVDTVFILTSRSVPVTAIDLTRVPATDTVVRVFLGEATS